MVRGHPVAVLANLAVLNGGVLGRGRRRAVAVGADAHAVDALVEAAHLELAHALLEELDVAAAVADLVVEAGADGLVVGRGAHVVGGVHEGPLLFNLALDFEYGRIFIHGGRGGGAMRSRETWGSDKIKAGRGGGRLFVEAWRGCRRFLGGRRRRGWRRLGWDEDSC